MKADATFAPGAGNDQSLDEVALHAVESGGLVMLVEQSEWHQKQAGLDTRPVIGLMIDIKLLHFKLALVDGRGDGVLNLKFRVEVGAIIEPVADAKDRARQIEFGQPLIVHWI